MKSIEILILTPGFPADEQDLNCIPSLQLLVRELSRHPGVSLRVITTQYPFRKGTYHWHGIPVYACGGRNRRLPWKLLTYLLALHRLWKWGRKVQVVQAFWLFECAFLAGLWSWWSGCLGVATLQGQDGKPGNGYFPLLRFWIKRSCLRIVALSEFGAARLLQNAGIRTDALIPYGYDGEIPAVAKSFSDRSWDVMGAGSLVPVKNFRRFVEVVKILKPMFPEIRCCILGGGPEKEMLEEEIRRAGLTPNLILEGERTRPEVLERMADTRVFLHTSDWEGQGFVLMESLARGCAVVASPVGYLPESHRSFVEPDAEAMADRLVRILRNPIEVRFVPVPSMKETARQYKAFYKIIISGEPENGS